MVAHGVGHGLDPIGEAAASLAGGIGCFVLGLPVTLTEMPALGFLMTFPPFFDLFAGSLSHT
jgi:hypothetical protein